MPAPRSLVVTCTYNERENIERLIPEIRQVVPAGDVLVVDDNSPDGTGELVDQFAANDVQVHAIHRAGKQGLGTAILAGLRYAIDNAYDYVVVMDADFSHHPRYLPALQECMQRADVAIGSRYMPGGGVTGWGPLRHFMSSGINWYARSFLGLETRDSSGSFRCYRVSKLRELDLDLIRSRGYAFQEEILYRCRRIGCTFAETPIVFEDRRYGESKISLRESITALWVIARLGVENLLKVRVAKRTTDATRGQPEQIDDPKANRTTPTGAN